MTLLTNAPLEVLPSWRPSFQFKSRIVSSKQRNPFLKVAEYSQVFFVGGGSYGTSPAISWFLLSIWSFLGVLSPWRLIRSSGLVSFVCGLVLFAYGLSCMAPVSLCRVSRSTAVTYFL
jgi:hypothetical protein